MIQKLVPISRKLWKITKEKMLPTPAKFHYVFNLRDLSRIWLGIIGTQSNVISTPGIAMMLWRHEISRILSDRFVSDVDKDRFDTEVISTVKKELGPEEGELVTHTIL